MPSYCGIPLLAPTEAQSALVRTHFDPLDIHEGVRRPYAREVPLNGMLWPHGACRWAEGWFLCTTEQLSQIQAAGGLTSGTLKFDDGTSSVTAQVSCLTPRPLLGDPNLNRLWLLLLVDERYWWWDVTTDDLDAGVGTSWADYVSRLAPLAGATVSFSGASPAFGKVPQGFAARDERFPVVLDRLASSLQCRLVRKTDGTTTLQTPAEVTASVAASLSGLAAVSAGGTQPLLVLPPSVKLTFPTTQGGVPSRDRYSASSSSGLPVGATSSPHPVTFNASSLATLVSGVATNQADLQALTDAFAAGWYALNQIRHDIEYVGVYPWTPDGATDLWLADSRTRAATRHDDEGGSDDLNLDAGAGTSEGDENNFYFTSITFDTTNLFWANNNYWYIDFGGSLTINGPGYLIVNAPYIQCGWLFWCYKSYTVATSQLDDWPLPSTAGTGEATVFRMEETADFAVSGIVPVITDDGAGQVIALANVGTNLMVLLHESTSSLAANRLNLEGAVNLTVAGGGIVQLWYDAGSGRWRVFEGGGGGDGGGGGAGAGKYERYYLETNRWYFAGHPPDIYTSNFGIYSTGLLYAFPFVAAQGGTLDAIGCCTGNEIFNAKVRLGIYSNHSDSDPRPHTLIYDSGDISCTTGSGAGEKKKTGLALDLAGDSLYWLTVAINDASLQLRSMSSQQCWPVLGSQDLTSNQAIGWDAASGYGPLPDPWPVGSDAPYAPGADVHLPLIGLYFSSLTGSGGGGGGSGTVTSVNVVGPAAGITATGGPITTSGVITLALADDLAALEALSGTNTIYYRSGVSTWSAVTVGSNLTFSGGTLSATGGGGSGTVTSVGVAVNNGITLSGTNPITGSGTFTFGLGNITPTSVAATGTGSFTLTDASPASAQTVLTVGRNNSGTPGDGYALYVDYKLQSSTTPDRNAARDIISWATAADGSRKARRTFCVWDATNIREGFQISTDGSHALIGFFGTTGVAQQTGDVGAAMQTYGLISGVPTYACGSLTGTLAAGQFPALTGDVTTVAGSLATTIAANAVTLAKIQVAAASSKLLGSGSSGVGVSYSEITLGTGLSMSGTTLNASATTPAAHHTTHEQGGSDAVTSLTLSQTGLAVKGATANALTIKPNETLTAARTLNVVTGDATRTLTFTADATIGGTNSGDQTITLTGDVTGSGTGSFATAIGASKVTNAMLAGSIDLATKVTGILPAADFPALTGAVTTSAGSLATALTTFVAAGASHAKGGVPDPGSTAHANRVRLLADDAAFHIWAGEFINGGFVATSETTASTTAADLTTTTGQTFTFTMDEGGDVWVQVGGTHSNNTVGAVNRLHVTVDGTATTVSQSACAAASTNYNMANGYRVTLGSGSHTIKLQFSCNAGTATFSNRSISVTRAS